MKILLCDDSNSVHSVLSMILEDLGHALVGTFNAYELISQFENSPPFDVIVLDSEMPKVSGMEALQFLQRSGCSTPIIMLTGKNSASNIKLAKEAGASSYIMKPFTKNLIEGALKQLN